RCGTYGSLATKTLRFVLDGRSASSTISNQNTKCGTLGLWSTIRRCKWVSVLQISEADSLFDIVFAKMLSQLYTVTPKRAEDFSCGTAYNRLTQYRRRQQPAQQ
ncbi:hypothetical protein GN958_ATG07798, partial [Phytophthora infestans]